MTKLKIAVKGNRAAVLGPVDLVAGTVGQKCQIFFDDEWNAVEEKRIVYKVGSTVIANREIESNEFIIPPDVLAIAGLPLSIGISGLNEARTMQIPTTWCPVGVIKEGAANSNAGYPGKQIIYDGGVII